MALKTIDNLVGREVMGMLVHVPTAPGDSFYIQIQKPRRDTQWVSIGDALSSTYQPKFIQNTILTAFKRQRTVLFKGVLTLDASDKFKLKNEGFGFIRGS